ncbi:hypothetical protein GOP47_0017270 [Adiantum capillus-veneris]|uniref:Uncharacterized protein n=1 Tax=Adiantum capillus-veneris TaxID=13818 RepID=A0A9D4ZAF3_ADICA|nr:hypothetical protein GOP47_0017270 [Adiantum capillus-veneris]
MVVGISLAQPLAAVSPAGRVLRASKGSGCPEVHMKSGGGALLSSLSQKQEVEIQEQGKRGTSSPSMLSKLGQRFNSAGIASAAHVMLRQPQISLPHIEVSDISSIDWNALRLCGFQGVVLDKDNTVTAPYVETIWPSLASSLDDCKKAFDGRVALLSNSAGLYQYDPDGIEAAALEQALKISVLRHGSKKPDGSPGELEKHFGCDASLLVMVGDRYFTDVVYGNRNGLLTFITKPLTLEGEPLVVKQVRALEEFLVRRWREKGIMPVKHKLMSCSNKFVKDPVTLMA